MIKNTVSLVILFLVSSVFTVYAGSNATVQFSASIAKAACDLNLSGSQSNIDLGVFSMDQFPAVGTAIDSDKTLMLNFGQCQGANVPKGEVISLIAHEDGSDPIVKGYNLFGNNNTGFGIHLNASSIDNGVTKKLGLVTPDVGLPIMTAAQDTNAEEIKLPNILINPGVTSYSTQLKAEGTTANVIFSAVYQ